MFSPWRMDGGMAAPRPGGLGHGAWPAFPGYTPAAMPTPSAPGIPTGPLPLRAVSAGAFPVPDAISAEQLPASAKDALLRVLEAPPKPAVTRQVMDATQTTMIAPDLPFRSDV